MTAYARRQFAGGSIVTTVPLSMGSSDTSFTLAVSTNWPDGSVGNFTIVVDFGLSTQEKILCSNRSGLVVTVASGGRGYDGTSAVAHSAGAAVQCVHIAQDDDEANQVVAGVLGQSGAAKGDILAMLSAAGPNTLTRLALGSTGQNVGVGGSGLPVYETIPGRVLARTVYAPSGNASYALVTGTPATNTNQTLDATNLTVTFTVPASGNVVVKLMGFATATATNFQVWYLVTHGSDTIKGDAMLVLGSGGTSSPVASYITAETPITGLTPGASVSLDWAATASALSSCSINVGNGTTSPYYGPGIIEVIAA